ncbi:MAG: (2Fe-2S) ferredoxin domain-containing protein [Ignavibacteriaceae bacterium]|nr:(2Fe-2S) ferredoxin domain-containing protein [Ignavibacteriaceae bacterium]NUM70423.1 (2Fe-2S) ferredoxin domain-containing protein [Ignavibacteriaceae bacterium]
MKKYKKHIFICENKREEGHPRGCCHSRGAEEIKEAFKNKIKLAGLASSIRANSTGCLNNCELGPSVVIYPEGVWYGRLKPDDIDEIIEKHLKNDEIVERLLMENIEKDERNDK